MWGNGTKKEGKHHSTINQDGRILAGMWLRKSWCEDRIIWVKRGMPVLF